MGPAEDNKYKVPLFDGENFSNWKFRMETLLDELEVLECLKTDFTLKIEKEEDEKTRSILLKKEKKCRTQIVMHVSDTHLEYVKDHVSCYGIWKSLNETFEKRGIASQLLLRKKLLLMKFKGDNLADHFLNFDRLIRELKSTGATLEETDITCHLLLTMPENYDNIVTAIETLSESVSLSFVKNRLLEEETKRKSRKTTKESSVEPSLIFAARGSGKKRFQRGGGTMNFPFKCHGCGKIGHKIAECQNKRPSNQWKGKATVAQEQSYTFVAAALKTNEINTFKTKWYLDSGATHHMISKDLAKNLENIKTLEKPVDITVANGNKVTVNKEGDLPIIIEINGEEIKTKIQSVLVVSFPFNLLSVSRLEDKGYKIVIVQNQVFVSRNGVVVLRGKRKGQLYEITFTLDTKTDCAVAVDSRIWHARLGHISNRSLRVLKELVNNVNIKGTDEPFCEICVKGKQTKFPHTSERVRAKRPLQLIHSDVMGPINPVPETEEKYLVTFIDDYTHFTAVYLMRSKMEVFENFKKFEAMVTAQFPGLQICRFRCDRGTEYLNKAMSNYFDQKGIRFECTIRYTPQQNGVAERMNRSIMEKARCMMFHAQVPKTFWPEAVLASVYIINRSPTTALEKKVPAELWYGEKVNGSKFRVFGCTAYLKDPLVKGKIASRSIKCVMVGYTSNGYHLWCPEKKIFIDGRDIVFDEKNFIFANNSSQYRNYSEEKDESNSSFEDDSKSLSEDEQENNPLKTSEKIITVTDDKNLEKPESEETSIKTKTRSGRITKTPKYLEDFILDTEYSAFALCSYVDNVPETFEEIFDREDSAEWLKAAEDEITALKENNTWELTELPDGKRAIDNKWVFKIKTNEVKCFLGINIVRDKNSLFLNQTTYLKKVLKRFNMENCKPVKTPWEPKKEIEEESELIIGKKPYRELIGCLSYAMLNIRPDISAVVNFYSQLQCSAKESNWKALKRFLRYIKGTLNLGLQYKRNRSEETLVGYADSDWAGSKERRSTSGHLLEVYGNPVVWSTKKQTSVALSSTEAEYIALANATAELQWLRGLLVDLGVIIEGPVKIYEDNQACIKLLQRWDYKRLKHVDV